MKTVSRIVVLALLTVFSACGKSYTCSCTENRYSYDSSGNDSTLFSMTIVVDQRAYTKYNAEQKCFSSYAKERSTYTTALGTKGVSSTTCVVY